MKIRLLYLLALALFLAQIVFQNADLLIDDTFISIRYAKNWVDGNGLVFNPTERVEGYTNFTFVVLAAAFLKLGLEPVFWLKMLALATALISLGLLTRLERRLIPGTTWPGSVLLLLPLPSFAYWAFGGLETMFFTGLLLAAVAAGLRESRQPRRPLSVLLFVLLALTRPEGVFCFALASLMFFLTELGQPLPDEPTATFGRRLTTSLRRHLLNGLIFAVLYGLYFLGRFWYFGDLFPNTYYAKVTGGAEQWLTGLEYLHKLTMALPLFVATLLLPLVFPFLRPSRGLVAIYGITLGFTVYVVSVGGDFMAHFRFFVPLMPFCALMLCWLVHRFRLKLAVLTAACVLQMTTSLVSTQREVAFVAHRYTVVGKHVGRWLEQIARPEDWIAVNTAGAVPYFSGLQAIDMLGLTDRAIAHRPIYIVSTGWSAHRRGWGEYVVQRRPRFIFWYNMAGARDPFYLSDREMADDPYFRFFYQLKTKVLPGDWDPNQPHYITRFHGFPFGGGPQLQEAPSPDMGLLLRFQDQPYDATLFYEGPITLNYFERDLRDDDLWVLRERYGANSAGFLDAVASFWQSLPPQPFDAQARVRIEEMCLQAQRLLQAGQRQQATQLLATAESMNETARSPLVYQYLANLGVMAGDPFVAVRAQKEALRLDPYNPLYLANLKVLLRQSYAEAKEKAMPASSPSSGGQP